MMLRSMLFATSIVLGALGAVASPDAGLFAPTARVSPAVLIALTALPTDAIGDIAKERLAQNG